MKRRFIVQDGQNGFNTDLNSNNGRLSPSRENLKQSVLLRESIVISNWWLAPLLFYIRLRFSISVNPIAPMLLNDAEAGKEGYEEQRFK